MIDALDVTSVTLVGMIAGLSMAVAMLLNWLVQKQQPGVALWAVGYLLASTGFILLGMRHIIPPFWSVVVANAMLAACWCCIWIGLRHFVGGTSSRWLPAGFILTAHVSLISYFLYVVPDLASRIIVYSVFNSALALLCAWELLRHISLRTSRAIDITLVMILAIHVVFNAVRLFHTATNPAIGDLLKAGAIHKLAFIEGIVNTIMQACCLIIASNQRLRLMLEEYQAKLEDLASTDNLSGLSNRRHFIEEATREIDRACRYGRKLSLIMVDVDHFKAINDNYGHLSGDEVIKTISRMFRQELREQDIVSRIGGEEFAALLPETDVDTATEVAERLRAALASSRTLCRDGQEIACTASFGVTEFSEGDQTIYDMLPRADQALYAAKNAGRNRVMVTGQGIFPEMDAEAKNLAAAKT